MSVKFADEVEPRPASGSQPIALVHFATRPDAADSPTLPCGGWSPMPIPLTCRCKTAIEVPDRMAGNTTMCPECGAFLDVPEPGKRVSAAVERDIKAERAKLENETSTQELKQLGPGRHRK